MPPDAATPHAAPPPAAPPPDAVPPAAPRPGRHRGARGPAPQAAFVLAALLLPTACPPAFAGPPGRVMDHTAPAPPAVSRLVEIAPGRRLRLLCAGQGAPTVLLEAGLGGTADDWRDVQSRVSRVTTTCAYDRAGTGLSDPGPLPRTSAAIADDLHALLGAANLPAPVVLVAHSMGALGALLFAFRHLDALAGMVLVDPSFPGQAAVLAPLVPEAAPHGDPATATGSEANSMSSASPRPEDSDTAQLAAEARDLGPFPLIVLTGADTGGADPADPRLAAAKSLWKAGHDALAARSRRGVSRLVPGAGHAIPSDRPDVVAAAILEIVGELRPAVPE